MKKKQIKFNRSSYQKKQWKARSHKERISITKKALETRKITGNFDAYMRDRIVWNKGKRMSKAYKEAMSKRCTGIPHNNQHQKRHKWTKAEKEIHAIAVREGMRKKYLATHTSEQCRKIKDKWKREAKCKLLRETDPVAYQKHVNKRVSDGCKKSYRNGRKPVGTKMYQKYKYRGVYMKSSYEVIFAKWCKKHGIHYQYEPKRFDLPKTTYTPDFYLSLSKIWVEVKGHATLEFWKKLVAFHQYYPTERILIINQPMISGMRRNP